MIFKDLNFSAQNLKISKIQLKIYKCSLRTVRTSKVIIFHEFQIIEDVLFNYKNINLTPKKHYLYNRLQSLTSILNNIYLKFVSCVGGETSNSDISASC